MSEPAASLLLIALSILAGAQNALAGGGSFITLSALLLTGLDPRAANITSTIALFPSQAVSGWAGRSLLTGATPTGPQGSGLIGLCALGLVGGIVGALLLLVTPTPVFTRLVPWLVLFATGVFAWGSYLRKPVVAASGLSRPAAMAVQGAIAIYGGYFGGGIGFLLLAALTGAGLPVRMAGATKNVLAAVINCGAVGIFLWSAETRWKAAALVCAGSIAGGLFGTWALRRIPERLLRGGIVAVGLALTVVLFARAG